MKAKKYANALVLGLGVSGAAAAELLLGEGTAVTALDAAANRRVEETARVLRRAGAKVLTGADELPAGSFDVCVVSPGIAADSAWVRQADQSGAEVISELELGASRCGCPCLAITGTNGKSTLTKLCAQALEYAGLRAAPAGNYGAPLCGLAADSAPLDWAVVEVSSFQLEKTYSFRPAVGVLLNLQPDHMDRHGDMRAYMRVKARLFANMTAGDTAIVHQPVAAEAMQMAAACASGASRGAGVPQWVTFGETEQSGVQYSGGRIIFRGTDEGFGLDLSGTYFGNPVAGLTAAAAAAAMRACGVDPSVLQAVARDFRPLPHRMTTVREAGGIIFVDDSKATNLSALAAALRMADRPVRLIAGGLLKEGNLKSIQEILAKKVCALYVIGKAAAEMKAAWGECVPCKPCGNLEGAVREAWKDARAGEMILLSPGCASFDQFLNFEDRGNQFTKIARKIDEET